MPQNYNTVVVANQQLAEAGKFIDLSQNTRFPSVSVLRIQYPDKTAAFPGNTNATPTSSYEIYPKYGIISYIANTDEFAVTLSAGQVSLDTSNLEAHTGNIDVNVSDIENILNHSFIALSAIDLNTFDTVTAINVFNQSFNQAITSLEVSIKEQNGSYYSVDNFNLHGTNGFGFDDNERPFFAIRVTPNTSRTIIVDEYSIINTDTAHICGYKWYLNPTTSVTPTFSSLTPYIQYAFFPKFNTASTISGNLSTIKHAGVFSLRNAENDENTSIISLTGGATPPILVLSVQHLNGTGTSGVFFTANVKDIG